MPKIKLRKPGPPAQPVFTSKIKQDLFARELIKDFNRVRAIGAAGFKGNNLTQAAYELLKLPYVQDKIRQLLNERAERLQIAGDDIARHFFAIATADARELCPVVVACCRFCHGIDHQYQYTTGEMRRARTKHLIIQMRLKDKDRKPFDEQGGDGYDYRVHPDPDCTECNGAGVTHAVPIDVSKLSPQGALLFDGYKIAKDGSVEIKIRDRTRAMENLVELLGFNRKRAVTHFDPDAMDDTELDAALEALAARRLISKPNTTQGIVNAEAETIDQEG